MSLGLHNSQGKGQRHLAYDIRSYGSRFGMLVYGFCVELEVPIEADSGCIGHITGRQGPVDQ